MRTDDGRSGAVAPSGHSPSGLSQSSLSQAQPSVPNALELPAPYSHLTPDERREARRLYALRQGGNCYYCGGALTEEPPESVRRKRIDWKRFPPNFLRYPHHLHHDHGTDMTIGVVHALCNAVLWQYHGE